MSAYDPRPHAYEEKAQLAGEPGQVVWEERYQRNISMAESQAASLRMSTVMWWVPLVDLRQRG